MCQGGYKIPRRTKGVIRSSQGRRPSLRLLNKIHQDSVSPSEYITFAKITGEREIILLTVTPAFKAIWEEVQTLTTDGISNDRLFRSLSHPFTYQSFCTTLRSPSAPSQWLDTVKSLDYYACYVIYLVCQTSFSFYSTKTNMTWVVFTLTFIYQASLNWLFILLITVLIN